jgi:site-specific DNA-cytosine methylase
MLAEPGFHTRAFVEWDDWPRAVLIAAQRAGYFAPAPIWDDLRSFDARPFRRAFDAILAGYPCQPFSNAGKRGGSCDPRHLWPDIARVISECGPEWVFLENVAGHVTLGLETVLRELWDMGYTPAAGLFSAAEVGAPHQRLRIFILAHTDEPASGHGQLQPGREQRLYPQGGSVGAGHYELVDAESDRWREGWAGAELWLGRDAAPASAGGAMANAGGRRSGRPPARQDQQPGRAEAALQCCHLIFGAIARCTPDCQIKRRKLLFMNDAVVDERNLCQLPVSPPFLIFGDQNLGAEIFQLACHTSSGPLVY